MQPILKINLTTCQTEEFLIPADWERDYLGGASLAARILYELDYAGSRSLVARCAIIVSQWPSLRDSGPVRWPFRDLREIASHGVVG